MDRGSRLFLPGRVSLQALGRTARLHRGRADENRPQRRSHFDAQLGEWLREIETAATVVALAPSAPPVKPEKRFLAYCIERPLAWEGKELHFVLRVGTHLKDGGVKISDSRSQADLSNPPKYLVKEDFLVASMFHQRAGKRNYYEDLALIGGGWEEFLEAAHATGRLFWGEEIEKDKPAKKYIPVTFGPPQAVERRVEGAAERQRQAGAAMRESRSDRDSDAAATLPGSGDWRVGYCC